MSSLSNAKLTLASDGSSKVKITASVKVNYTDFELALMKLGVKGRLHLELWGEDGTIFNGGDDDLVNFGTRSVTKKGIQTFTASIPKAWLDEDVGGDEIYGKFTLSSSEPSFTLAGSAKTPTVSGSFG